MSRAKYHKICIDTLEELAMKDDIEAIGYLIEEGHNKQKWLERMSEIVQNGATIDVGEEHAKEIIVQERRKAAVKLLRISKKLTDEEDISIESILKARETDGLA